MARYHQEQQDAEEAKKTEADNQTLLKERLAAMPSAVNR